MVLVHIYGRQENMAFQLREIWPSLLSSITIKGPAPYILHCVFYIVYTPLLPFIFLYKSWPTYIYSLLILPYTLQILDLTWSILALFALKKILVEYVLIIASIGWEYNIGLLLPLRLSKKFMQLLLSITFSFKFDFFFYVIDIRVCKW